MIIDFLINLIYDFVFFFVNFLPLPAPVQMIIPESVLSGITTIIQQSAYFLPIGDLIFFMSISLAIYIFRLFFTFFFRVRELLPFI